MSAMTRPRALSATTEGPSQTTGSAFEDIPPDVLGPSPRERAGVVATQEVERRRHRRGVSGAHHGH